MIFIDDMGNGAGDLGHEFRIRNIDPETWQAFCHAVRKESVEAGRNIPLNEAIIMLLRQAGERGSIKP